MQNLMMNSAWVGGARSNDPQYFTNDAPITFNSFRLRGFRTCSICMPAGRARNTYDLPVCVSGHCALCFGYCIRAIEANSIRLGAEFFDASGVLLTTKYADITTHVTYRFGVHLGLFPVPEEAASARLFLEFSGRIVACTFCAPRAFYYGGTRRVFDDPFRRDIFEDRTETEPEPRAEPAPDPDRISPTVPFPESPVEPAPEAPSAPETPVEPAPEEQPAPVPFVPEIPTVPIPEAPTVPPVIGDAPVPRFGNSGA